MSSNRMIWLDSLRLLAGLSMVGLHSSSDATGQPFPGAAEIERVFPVLFRSVIYIARTELFIIISLFLLCMAVERRPRSYGSMVREQAQRLLVPFAFWAVFFAFYKLIKAYHFGYFDGALSQLFEFSSWAGFLLLGNVQYHMHFLPTLFPLVLFLPLYRKAVERPELGLVIIACLFLKREADVYIWANLQGAAGFEYIVRIIKIFSYVGYGMVAGAFYGLLKREFSQAQIRSFFWIGLVIGLGLYAIKLVYSFRVIEAGDWQYNFTPAYWADFMMPVVVFGVIMTTRNKDWPLLLSRIAPFSFGIYLTHPIFLDVVEILTQNQSLSPTELVLTKVVFALTCTSVFVFAISKSRLFGWTIGLGEIPQFKFATPKASHS